MTGGLQFDAIQFSGDQINPDEIAEENELHQNLMDAINALSEKDREITLNFYYDQLSLSEIAALYGISLGTAKVRLLRARQRLKTTLLTQYPDIVPYRNRRKPMIEVTIADVIKQSNMHVLILKDEANKRILPIWVGAFEGESIATGLGGLTTPRPLTFYFFTNLLKAIKADIEKVRIEQLKENTFYAVVEIRCGREHSEVDARPSDAIALAVINNTPIVVAENVMEKAGIEYPESVERLNERAGVNEIMKYYKETLIPQKYRQLSTEELRKAREGLLSILFPTQQ
jgi:bifunctional DNase/RNase